LSCSGRCAGTHGDTHLLAEILIAFTVLVIVKKKTMINGELAIVISFCKKR
jgi:hypothetical protein